MFSFEQGSCKTYVNRVNRVQFLVSYHPRWVFLGEKHGDIYDNKTIRINKERPTDLSGKWPRCNRNF